jgi:hypothetical protein
VPGLTRIPAGAGEDLTSNHESGAQPDVRHDVGEVLHVLRCPEVALGQRRGIGIVVNERGHVQLGGQSVPQWDVAPSHVGLEDQDA